MLHCSNYPMLPNPSLPSPNSSNSIRTPSSPDATTVPKNVKQKSNTISCSSLRDDSRIAQGFNLGLVQATGQSSKWTAEPASRTGLKLALQILRPAAIV